MIPPWTKAEPSPPTSFIAISILAGGLSARMGRDKSRMRLGRSTMLARVRQVADAMGLPVRVIRRDLVPRCGPLGGIYTALRTSRATAEIFLACDMPFVPVALLRQLVRRSDSGQRAAFAAGGSGAGFPLVIPVKAIDVVETQVRGKQWSLQALAHRLRAVKVVVPRARERELLNINSPADWSEARAFLLRGARFLPRPALRRRIRRKSPLSARRSKVKVRA